jgi:hypothetical protein
MELNNEEKNIEALEMAFLQVQYQTCKNKCPIITQKYDYPKKELNKDK